jgi:hypothetical protein
LPRKCRGIKLALSSGVSFRAPLRAALILLPLVTTATTIHAHRLAPDLATQEMNRCLKLVRIAASRRKSKSGGSGANTAHRARASVVKRPPRSRRSPRAPRRRR